MTTRALIHTILRGELHDCATGFLPGLNLTIPRIVHGIEADVLNPRDTWHDKNAYDEQARRLVALFNKNFERFQASPSIRAAGPSFDERMRRAIHGWVVGAWGGVTHDLGFSTVGFGLRPDPC